MLMTFVIHLLVFGELDARTEGRSEAQTDVELEIVIWMYKYSWQMIPFILLFRWYCWSLQWLFTSKWIHYWCGYFNIAENFNSFFRWFSRFTWSRCDIFCCQACKWCYLQASKKVRKDPFLFWKFFITFVQSLTNRSNETLSSL